MPTNSPKIFTKNRLITIFIILVITEIMMAGMMVASYQIQHWTFWIFGPLFALIFGALIWITIDLGKSKHDAGGLV